MPLRSPDFFGRAPHDDEAEQALPRQHRHPDQDEGLPRFHPGGSAVSRCATRNDGIVIASEAKQSGLLCRFWIASSLTLLAVTR
jgi:hypothetical protein